MKKSNTVFFPGLNGLRAIAALAVIASHITVSLDQYGLNAHLMGTLANGNPKGLDMAEFAVSVFFSLSGFLITYLLLAEDREDSINIKNFYIRRALRIWPLYYLYLGIGIYCIYNWRIPHAPYSNFFFTFFLPNVPKILQQKSELLGHYWSVGVEEQFYFFWPIFVKIFIKRLKTAIPVLLAFLVGLKLIAHEIFPDTLFETAMYVNRFDCMVIGALGALFLFNNNKFAINLATHGATQAMAWATLGLAALNRFHIAAIFDHEFMGIVTVVIIFGQIHKQGAIIGLNNRVFDFLGKISYGLYIIHPLVIFLLPGLFRQLRGIPAGLNYILVYTVISGLTIVCSHLSYKYLEKPFLHLKNRFATVQSAMSLPAV